MGDGKKLKEYLDEKGTNVRRITKETGISATTLYTIIQKDSNIRFDFALRLANALNLLFFNKFCLHLLRKVIYFTRVLFLKVLVLLNSDGCANLSESSFYIKQST